MSNTEKKKIINRKVKDLEEFYNNGKKIIINNKNLSEKDKEDILSNFEENIKILKEKI